VVVEAVAEEPLVVVAEAAAAVEEEEEAGAQKGVLRSPSKSIVWKEFSFARVGKTMHWQPRIWT
jgi:hypothetical protein